MKHTKTPWTFELLDMQGAGPYIHEDGGAIHFKGNPRNRKLNILLRHGVRCVNLHDDLVAACEAVGTRHRIMYRAHEQTGTDERGYWIDAETMKAVQAALAKVKEANT